MTFEQQILKYAIFKSATNNIFAEEYIKKPIYFQKSINEFLAMWNGNTVW